MVRREDRGGNREGREKKKEQRVQENGEKLYGFIYKINKHEIQKTLRESD